MKKQEPKTIDSLRESDTLTNKKISGITLIALVITIVILIILAGVLVSLTLGNNGLFNKAKLGKELYANAQDYEDTQIAKTANELDNYVTGSVRTDSAALQGMLQNYSKKPIILTGRSDANTPEFNFSNWTTIDKISLAGYGTGIAMISCSIQNTTNDKSLYNNSAIVTKEKTSENDNTIGVIEGDTQVAFASDYVSDTNTRAWIAVNLSGAFRYTENTLVGICSIFSAKVTPMYIYSIVLFPD